MAERSLASCEACGYDAGPAARVPGVPPTPGFARRALGKAMACAAVAGVLWASAPAWLARLPHLAEHLPVDWQLALARNPLFPAGSTPQPSTNSLGPLLHAAKARGELVVAVRHYRRPAVAGAQAPLEPDRFDAEMATFLSTRLGLPLRLVMTGSGDAAADLVIAGSPSVNAGGGARIPTTYTGGTGALVVLRGSPLMRAADLRGKRVCVATGSPYARVLVERHGATVRPYAAAVQAVAGFMAGECQALADDELTVARLMRVPEWRFYRRLDLRLRPDNRTAQIALRAGDARSIAWLDEAVRQWKAGGALIEARQHRAADVGFEASQLQDGLVCHS
jgi:polar amino acid transport system substrate-binding protein